MSFRRCRLPRSAMNDCAVCRRKTTRLVCSTRCADEYEIRRARAEKAIRETEAYLQADPLLQDALRSLGG